MPSNYFPEKHHAMFYRRQWLASDASKLLLRALVFKLPRHTHKALHDDIDGEAPPTPAICHAVLEGITAPTRDICRLDQAIHRFDDISLSARDIDDRRKAGRLAEFLYRQRPYILEGQRELKQ